MLSPAAQHRLKVSAASPESASKPLSVEPVTDDYSATHEPVFIGQFKADFYRIKQIKSRTRRTEAKRLALSRYQGWLNTFMQQPSHSTGAQAGMFVWLLLWHLDINDWRRGLVLAQFALAQGFFAPKDFSRTLVETVCEEIAGGILKATEPADYVDIITDLMTLVAGQDMTDPITAKLYKVYGLAKLTSQPDEAKTYFLQALSLDAGIGVKRYLKALDTTQKARKAPVDIQAYSLSARAAAQLANMTAPAFLRHAKKWPEKLPYIAIPVGTRTLYRFNPLHVRAYIKQHHVAISKDANHVQS